MPLWDDMEKEDKIKLLAFARDEDAPLEERKEAILKLTSEPDAEVCSCLEDLLQSQATAIRYYARRSLNSIKAPGPQVHAQPRPAGTAPQSDSLADQVIALRAETDPFKIGQLLTSIGQSADSTLIPIIQAYLDDENPRVRAGAIEALENIGNPEVAQMIMPFLKDEDNRVKGNAAKFLWRYSPDDVFDEMRDMLSSGKEWEEASALYVLSSIETNRKDELLAIATKSVNPDIRKKAMAMLEKEQSRLESSKKILDSYMKAAPVSSRKDEGAAPARRTETGKKSQIKARKSSASKGWIGAFIAGAAKVAVYLVILGLAGYGGFEAFKGYQVVDRVKAFMNGIKESAINDARGGSGKPGPQVAVSSADPAKGTTDGGKGNNAAVAATGEQRPLSGGESSSANIGGKPDGAASASVTPLKGPPADPATGPDPGTAAVTAAQGTAVTAAQGSAVPSGQPETKGSGPLGLDTAGVSLNLGIGPGDLNMGPVIRRKAGADAEARADWAAAARIYMALAEEQAEKSTEAAAGDFYSASRAYMAGNSREEALFAYVRAVTLSRDIMEKSDNGIVASAEKLAASLKGGPKSLLAEEIEAMVSYFSSSLSTCRDLCKKVLAKGEKVLHADLVKAIDAMAAADIDKVKVKLPVQPAAATGPGGVPPVALAGGKKEMPGPDVSAEMKKAEDLVKKGEPAKAIDALREVLTKDPVNLEALSMMADVNQSIDSYDDAIESLEKMVGIDPRNPQTHFRLSDLYSQKQYTVKAKKSLGMVLLCDTEGTFSQAAREKILKMEGISQ